VNNDVEKQAYVLDDHRNHPLNDCSQDDDSMSVERLDDAVAAITFTATVITITLGFLFNL
jgi:hypothetical protein